MVKITLLKTNDLAAYLTRHMHLLYTGNMAEHFQLSELRPPLKPVLVADLDGLSQCVEFLSSVNEFGFDTETNVVDDFVDRRIRTIQVGNRDVQYVIDLLAFAGSPANLVGGQGGCSPSGWAWPVVEALNPFLEGDKTKLGTYLQFDYEVMKWCLGIRTANLYDCHIAHKIINAGKAGFWQDSMTEMVLTYCGLNIDKSLQTSFDLESPLTQDQIGYAALDVRIPFAIRAGQAPLIEKFGLQKTVYQVELPAIQSFGDMHLNGMHLSPTKWMEIIDRTVEEHKQHIETLDKHFLPIVGSVAKPEVDVAEIEKAWKDEKDKAQRAILRARFYEERRKVSAWEKDSKTWEGQAAINYGSSDQLIAALRKAGFDEKKLPNTNDRTLKKLNHKIIAAIQSYRKSQKVLDTYGVSFLEYICKATGRVHSSIYQMGAETGRTSSKNPNLQNIPKEAEWRACFIEEDPWVVITIDMAGAELRILAEMSGETAWIDAFNKGWDVHSVGAEILFGQRWKDGTEDTCAYYHTADHQKCKCKVHKDLRNSIKAINFGIAYGMEAGKLSEELGINKGEAQELLDLYRKTFARVTAFLKSLGDSAKAKLVARTMGGRCRFFTRPTWDLAKAYIIKEAKKATPDLSSKNIGRKFHGMLGSIEREGKNTPIQGGNADIAKVAMGFIWEKLESEYGAFLINFVHDEFVVRCHKDRAEECAVFLGNCIRRAGEVFMSRVKMESEFHIAGWWVK